MYEYTDKVLKRLVREIHRQFEAYRGMKYDELNVFNRVKNLYSTLADLNEKAYKDIGQHYYAEEGGEDDTLGMDFLIATLLVNPNALTKYIYSNEVTRKRDRLVEALQSTGGNPEEYDKAARYWTLMTGWYAVEVTDATVLKAWKERGVKRVRWRTEHDDKVCEVCRGLDGEIFDIDKIPTKPHPNCRCWWEIVE